MAWKSSQIIDDFSMDKQGRYSTSGMIEGQYMAGSDGKVLKNLLNVTTNREIDRVETEFLFVLTDQVSYHCPFWEFSKLVVSCDLELVGYELSVCSASIC